MAEPPADGPVRIGVLGAAAIARRKMLPAILAEPAAELVAVASRSLDRARALTAEFGGEPVAGYPALLARPDVDAVYLPLPTGLHAHWARQALLAGKHVLVEKPLTPALAEAEELVELARQRRLQLSENFAFVEHAQHRQLRELLDAGVLGELRAISADFGIPPLPATDIRYDPALGGGALLDTGVYPIRAATMLLGARLAVAGSVAYRPPAAAVDLGGSVLLAAPDGTSATLGFGFAHAYRCAYTVWGSAGRLSVERAFTAPPGLVPTATLHTADGERRLPLAADDQFRGQLRRFTAAVRAGDRCFDAEILEQARLLEAVGRLSGVLGDRG